jgi:hypothetical protein
MGLTVRIILQYENIHYMEVTTMKMTKVFLSTALLLGFAFTTITPVAHANTIGNDIGAIQLLSQNQGANTGNVGSTNSHGSSNGNALANNIADQSNVSVVNTVKVLEDPCPSS